MSMPDNPIRAHYLLADIRVKCSSIQRGTPCKKVTTCDYHIIDMGCYLLLNQFILSWNNSEHQNLRLECEKNKGKEVDYYISDNTYTTGL